MERSGQWSVEDTEEINNDNKKEETLTLTQLGSRQWHYVHRVKEPVLLLSTHLHICVHYFSHYTADNKKYLVFANTLIRAADIMKWSLLNSRKCCRSVLILLLPALSVTLLLSLPTQSSLILGPSYESLITIHLVEALAVGHTLLADVDELHGQLQLPPLRPARCGVDM